MNSGTGESTEQRRLLDVEVEGSVSANLSGDGGRQVRLAKHGSLPNVQEGGARRGALRGIWKVTMVSMVL